VSSLTLDYSLLLTWQIIVLVFFLGHEHARVVTEDSVLVPDFGQHDWAVARPRVDFSFAHHGDPGDSHDAQECVSIVFRIAAEQFHK